MLLFHKSESFSSVGFFFLLNYVSFLKVPNKLSESVWFINVVNIKATVLTLICLGWVRTRPCWRALLLCGSFQHGFKCKHEAILDILDFLKCGWILLLALVAVLQRSLLKTPLPPSKQKIPGTCLRNNNNLQISNVWFCTKLYAVTFQEKNSFAPLSKAVKSQ